MKFLYTLFYIIAYIPIKIMFPCKFRGFENIIGGKAIVCANHSGMADPILMAYAFRLKFKLRFMSKKEFTETPILGKLCMAAGVFPVDRGTADIGAIRTMMAILKDNEKVMMFPEGTRVVSNDALAAKTGAVRIASKTESPIIPCYIQRGKGVFRMNRVVIGEPYYVEKIKGKDYEPQVHELMSKIYGLEKML